MLSETLPMLQPLQLGRLFILLGRRFAYGRKRALSRQIALTHSTRMMRRKTKIAAVALANKMARMIRAIMFSGHPYREPEMRTA